MYVLYLFTALDRFLGLLLTIITMTLVMLCYQINNLGFPPTLCEIGVSVEVLEDLSKMTEGLAVLKTVVYFNMYT